MYEPTTSFSSIVETIAKSTMRLGTILSVADREKLNTDLDAARQEAQKMEAQLYLMQELVRTSALITSSLDISQVLEEVIDTIITLTRTTRGYLMLYEEPENDLRIQVARNWNHESLSEREIGYSRSVVQTALESRTTVLTTNAQADSLFQKSNSVHKYGLYFILCIPLIYRTKLIGVIYTDSSTNSENFNHDIVPVLTAFANQAVIAIENARLFDQVRADLERAQREIQRLRIQEVMVVSNDVLPKLVETIVQLLMLPYVAIVPKKGDASLKTAEYGTPEGDLLKLPLVYQAETVGELLLSKPTNRDWSENDEYLLNDFMQQAAVAVYAVCLTLDLQHSRERLIIAREEERRRLHRDLHDGLGPSLASITLKLDTARNFLKSDIGVVDRLLSELKTQVQSAIADIRRVVYELRPPALDELGLIPAIREHISQYNHQNALRITFTEPEQLPELSAAIEVAIYRIVLEALTNVVRHAHAHNCNLQLTSDNKVCVEIRDDGIGLPEDWHPGVGITSIRERAVELGGTCIIESRPGEGTHVQACLPMTLF